jgi:6-phospho-beta-glucosidase
VKVTIVGAGGFRTPLVYGALLRAAGRIGLDEVALYDRDAERVLAMRPVLAGLAAEQQVELPVRPEAELSDAVRGARYVLCAIRVGGLPGRVVDETVPLRFGVLGQETVGPGGIAFALRTLPAMREIAETVARCAPDAWLVNFTNPAGIITEGIQAVLGDRAIGICDTPSHLCSEVAAALELPERELAFEYAGLNHLGWLTGVRRAGRDLLPGLLEDPGAVSRLRAADLFGPDRLRRLRAVPSEYVYYYEYPDDAIDGFRRAGSTRAEMLEELQGRFSPAAGDDLGRALRRWRTAANERNRTYMAEARDEAPAHGQDDDSPPMGGYEGVATAAIEAIEDVRPQVMILNVANRGALPIVPPDGVVEVPCAVTPAGARPLACGPPPAQAIGLIQTVKQVEQLTLEASRTRSRALAVEALALHPVVPSVRAAEAILNEYLARLPELAAALD